MRSFLGALVVIRLSSLGSFFVRVSFFSLGFIFIINDESFVARLGWLSILLTGHVSIQSLIVGSLFPRLFILDLVLKRR